MLVLAHFKTLYSVNNKANNITLFHKPRIGKPTSVNTDITSMYKPVNTNINNQSSKVNPKILTGFSMALYALIMDAYQFKVTPNAAKIVGAKNHINKPVTQPTAHALPLSLLPVKK